MKKNICIVLTVILTAIFISQKIYTFEDFNPTVIIENHKFNNIVNHNLYKGDKVTGEFIANNNNLGIISTNFNTHWNINTDYLQFSIKEKGQDQWYYTNKYKVDQFQNNKYFPFGFPEINNSKNKTYQIQIESLEGTVDNSVMVSNQPFLSKYSFPKNFLLQNKSQIPIFLFNKTCSIFQHLSFLNYTFIIFISISIYLFFRTKNGECLLRYFKKKLSDEKNITITKNNNPLFYWYFWTLALVVIISLTIIFIKKHSESAEWLAYELSSIISFFALVKFNILNKKIKLKTIKKTIIFGIITLVFQLIFFTFFLRIISWRYLLIACISLIPAFIYSNNSTEKFLKILFINLFSIVCVSGYFVLNIDSFPLPYFIVTLLFVSIIPFVIIKNKISFNSLFVRIICILFLVIFISISIKKPIEYHHYSFYVGPAYEISQNKSILTESPSQYGYLSIHFVKNIISPFGINFNNFHRLNISLYVIYFICTYLIFKKITKNTFSTTILTTIAIGFQSTFSAYSAILYPSSGPLRFGIGMLIILSALYLKNNNNILVSTLLASIATFWSIETAIYIVPAWIFAITCQNYINNPKIKNFISKTVKQIGLLLGIIILIFLTIFLSEWIHIKSIPNILNFLQFANTYKEGYGSELIPKFGNHYIAISILLLGLTLSTYTVINKIKNNLSLALNFLTIHNIAIFSYFISRSHQNNIVNISIFLIIELAVCFKLIETIFFKKNNRNLYRLIIFPITLFITFFGIICFKNITNPNMFYSTLKTRTYDENYKKIIENYNLNSNNVLIISKDYDTLIITENKINTILPLNPCTMTTLLPKYKEKYLITNIGNISIGTTLVYTKDTPDLFTFFEHNFRLQPVIQSEKNELFDLYTFENKTNNSNDVK